MLQAQALEIRAPAKQEVSLHLVGQLTRGLNISIKAASQLRLFMVPVLSQSSMTLGGLEQQGLHPCIPAACYLTAIYVKMRGK